MANEKILEAVGSSITIGSWTTCLKSVQPIGVDGGEAIDVTCLSNVTWITKQPQKLREAPDITFSTQYHPESWTTINAEINNNRTITIRFNNNATLTFWGFLKTYEPQQAGKGDEWLANGTIVVTNMNDTGVEVDPVYTSP